MIIFNMNFEMNRKSILMFNNVFSISARVTGASPYSMVLKVKPLHGTS